jgi:hypothetical protein
MRHRDVAGYLMASRGLLAASRRRPPAGAGGLVSDQHVRSRVAVGSMFYLGREDSDI